MNTSPVGPESPILVDSRHDHTHHHGLFWSGIIAGAFASAALALILLSLGFGLGLSSISPWAYRGVSSTTLAAGAIVWLIASQIVASGMGGYLAGRLRHRWGGVHVDEIHFRDSAQGFLAGSVGIVMTAAFLASAGTAMFGAATPAVAGAAATGAASAKASSDATTEPGAAPVQSPNAMRAGGTADKTRAEGSAFYIDQLFRSDKPTDSNDGPVRAETTRIFTHAMRQGQLDAPDRAYVASLVAVRTGIPQAEADKRVGDAFNQIQSAADKAEADAKQAADAARKAAAHTALWLFVALLFGAFSASFFATIGGRHRDYWYPVVAA
jgi:hypothetical protein